MGCIHFELTEKRKEEIKKMALIMMSNTSTEIEEKIRWCGFSVSYVEIVKKEVFRGCVIFEEQTVLIKKGLQFEKDANYAVYEVLAHELGHIVLGHWNKMLEQTKNDLYYCPEIDFYYCPESESEANYFKDVMIELRDGWLKGVKPIVLSANNEEVSVIEYKGECFHQETIESHGIWYLPGLGQTFGVKTFCKKCNAFSFRPDAEFSYDRLERICSSVYRLGTWVRRVAITHE